MDLQGSFSDDSSSSPSQTIGFICAFISVFFFGSNFIPVKKFPTGDGIFFQWILCWGIWLCGLIVYLIRGSPEYYALSMIGGALWTTGNIGVVFVIQAVGLGQGLLIWGSTQLVLGWAVSRFGWFGIDKVNLDHVPMNYAGVVLCLVGSIIYLFIKSEGSTVQTEQHQSSGTTHGNHHDEEDDPLLDHYSDEDEIVPVINSNSRDNVPTTGETGRFKRIMALGLAVFAGLCFSVNFVPVIYVQDNTPGASQNALDYVFPHFTGIFLAGSVYFIIYCAVKCNKPVVYPSLVLPALLSGVGWAIADISWFIANKALSQSVSFPIIGTGPGIIGSLWAVFVFKEIKGARNYILLMVAIAVTVAGVTLTGLSLGTDHTSNTNTTTTTAATTTAAAYIPLPV